MRRSCGDPVEVLHKRSLHYALEDLLHGCLYESSFGRLIGSSCMKMNSFVTLYIEIYIEGPAAADAIMPHFICYCSIATVACIWYFDFLLPTLFAVFCRCSLFHTLFVSTSKLNCGDSWL